MSFTLALQSWKGTRANINSNNLVNYQFDFSSLNNTHQGKFKITFTFLTDGASVVLYPIDNIYIRHTLPVSTNTFLAGTNTQNGATRTSLLGYAKLMKYPASGLVPPAVAPNYTFTGFDCCFHAQINDNVPTIINSLPDGSQKFSIGLYSTGDALSGIVTTYNYQLNLFFEPIFE
jgi:hypothetical protein